jgi:hypothetical protein
MIRKEPYNNGLETSFLKTEQRKMSKTRKSLTTIALMLMLIYISALLPSVQATEPTLQEKSETILNDIAGFNMAVYASSLKAQDQDDYLTLTEKTVDLFLSSSQSNLRARCTFIGEHLHQIFISDIIGELSLNNQTDNTLDEAKGFMQRYQTLSGNSLFGSLKSMMENVDPNENTTRNMGNIQFKANAINNGQIQNCYSWTFIDSNGVLAPSKTIFLIYNNGVLKSFLDNWQLYNVAGAPELSRDQAISAALNALEDYSLNAVNTGEGNFSVSGFKVQSIGNVSLCYLNYREEESARGGDPFTLYPSWYVPVGFDKFYPGGVTGAYVRVWADTGTVSGISSMIVGLDNVAQPLETEIPNAMQFIFPITIISLLCSAVLIFTRRRESCFRIKTVGTGFHKVTCLVMCSFLLIGGILSTISTVNAVPANFDAKAMLYGSMYGQLEDEVDAIEDVCGTVYGYYDNAGYSVSNECGENTNKEFILANASSLESDFDCITILHIGHMDDRWGNAYYDNNGESVNLNEVYTETIQGKHFFAFLWICQCGVTDQWGNAWCHCAYINGEPSKCFIGFAGGSPALSSDSFYDYTALGKDVLMSFYDYALNLNYSVSDSLDMMSYDLFNECYSSSPLNCGYYTYWPYNPYFPNGAPPGWYPGHMNIFGNWNIYLAKTETNQHQVSVLARDQYGNALDARAFYLDDEWIGATDQNYWITEGYHTFGVSVPGGTTLQNFTYLGSSNSSNPMALSIFDDQTIIAYYNVPPTAPTMPELYGPEMPLYAHYYSTFEYTFSAFSRDINYGDTIRYQFDWDDGTSTTTDYAVSGATVYASHNWTSSGTKYVSVKAQDSGGMWSDWSDLVEVEVISSANRCWLTIYASDQYCGVSDEVYIGSEWVGMTNEPIFVLPGSYYLGVEEQVEVQYGTGMSYFWSFQDLGELFENPVYVTITGDTEFHAAYFNC